MRDAATIHRDHLVRPVLEQTGPTLGVHCVLDSGTPAQALGLPRQVRHGGHPYVQRVHLRRGQAGQADELLAHHASLELTLVGRRRVLEIAATATVRPGPRTRRLDPVRRGDEHLDGIGAQETLALFGDHRTDPFPRQGVPDEHDEALRRPGHAVPAVGHGSHLELKDGTLQPFVPSRGTGHDRVPTLRSPSSARGPRGGRLDRARSSRSRSFVEVEASCHGTLVTITPGSNSSRPLSRSALWLCSKLLPPAADDVLGDEDGDHVARGVAARRLRRSR